MMIAIWIVIIIGLIILEAVSTQLVGIWFAVAALISLILAFFGAEVWIQIVVFLVSSAVLLVATRPIAKRLLKGSPTHTNADRVIGMTAIVTEEIDNIKAKGTVSVLGQTWTARTRNDEIIPVDTKVTVVDIEGVKAIVEVKS